MLLTTSRNPSLKTKAFAKDLFKSFPKAVYVSRGKTSLEQLTEKARKQGKEVIVLVSEKHKLPARLQAIKVKEEGWQWFFEANLTVLKLRKDLSNLKQKFNSLKLKLKSRSAKKLLKALKIVSDEEARFELKEQKEVFSFFKGRQEIGPRFKVKVLRFEV